MCAYKSICMHMYLRIYLDMHIYVMNTFVAEPWVTHIHDQHKLSQIYVHICICTYIYLRIYVDMHIYVMNTYVVELCVTHIHDQHI